MYYYKARIYSPTLGRFMQTDPIGYGDGLNWYNYVGSDPVNKVDPTGMVWVRQCTDPVPVESDNDEIKITGQRCWNIYYPDPVRSYFDREPRDRVAGEGRVAPQSKKLSPCMINFLGSQGLGAPNLGDVTFHRGDGGNIAARTAFARGNPAITIGNNIYVKPTSWGTKSTPSGGATFFEEIVHTVQWDQSGSANFGLAWVLGSVAGALFTGDAHNSPLEAQAMDMSSNLLKAYRRSGSKCSD